MMLQPLVMQGFLDLCILDCYPEASLHSTSVHNVALGLQPSPSSEDGCPIPVTTPAPPCPFRHKSFPSLPTPSSSHLAVTPCSSTASGSLASGSCFHSFLCNVLQDFCIPTLKTLISNLLGLFPANGASGEVILQSHVSPFMQQEIQVFQKPFSDK